MGFLQSEHSTALLWAECRRTGSDVGEQEVMNQRPGRPVADSDRFCDSPHKIANLGACVGETIDDGV